MASPSESQIENQLATQYSAMKVVLDAIRNLNDEQKIRILASSAVFFNVQIEVVERIERARR